MGIEKLINLTGQKFGRLTVIKREYPNRNKKPQWLCKCECGTEKIIDGASLRTGHTKSCGCLQKETVENIGNLNKLDLGLSSFHALIRNYKNGAKRREIKYKLTEEQFKEITQKDCYYCGAKPNQINKGHRGYPPFGDYIYNGIDRIDNNKGYTIDNVVPCCKMCNQAKNDYTLQEFQDWVEKIYNKMFIR